MIPVYDWFVLHALLCLHLNFSLSLSYVQATVFSTSSILTLQAVPVSIGTVPA